LPAAKKLNRERLSDVNQVRLRLDYNMPVGRVKKEVQRKPGNNLLLPVLPAV
jgi:hypothetical protein